MSASALTQFLIDVTRGKHAAAYAGNSEAVIAASPIDNELRRAIVAQDIRALWIAGAHPMALLYFARACGWSAERYYECIADNGQGAVAPPKA